MAEDNNRDAKLDKKEAKRQAKIEAKRRKLAEQRANKAGYANREGMADIVPPMNADGTEMAPGAEGAADGQSADPHGSRQVIADSNNRERRILVDKYESGAAPDDEWKMPSPDEGEETEDPKVKPVPAAPAAAAALRKEEAALKKEQEALEKEVTAAQENEEPSPDAVEKEQPAVAAAATAKAPSKRAGQSILSRIGKGILKFLKWFFKKLWNGLRNMTPAMAVRLLVALVILCGLIYGALEIADRHDKQTDIFVTDEGFHHADKFESCVPLYGIDVSVHQEGDIDWKKVKTSGVDYVFVRAGYRAADDGSLHADETFEKNFKAAKKAGLMVGVYFFSQALTPEEGKEEADFVLDIIKDHDVTMPVVIDYEIYKDGRLDKKIDAGELYAASFYHDIVLGFTERLEKKGYETLVYASRDMLTNYMQADLIDDMANIWLARYDSVANLKADYWLWQCTEEAAVGGIQGNVDMSFWYMEPNKVYPTRGKRPKNAVSVGDCRISFKRSSYKLHNYRAEPKFDLTDEGKGMKEGRDYVSSVVHNTKAGTGYLIIRGIGKYKDWVMYPFTIEE